MDIKNISDLEEGFTELQHYSDTQFKTIVELKENIARLESENTSLKLILEQNVQNLSLDVTDLGFGISNEQLICETQISMLKERAVIAPLTLEETRKLEIYVNILAKYKSTKDAADISVKRLSDVDLIKIANGTS